MCPSSCEHAQGIHREIRINVPQPIACPSKTLAVLMLAAVLLCQPSVSSASENERVYAFGVVPQVDSRELFEVWQPLLNRLSRLTGLRIHLAGSAGIPEFEKALEQGWYDFAYMNPYHLLTAADAQGYRPLLRDGDSDLQGILVVRQDSPIHDVRQLAGKVIVFPAPNALGASLLPRAYLRNRLGLSFTERYVESHSSVYLNVAMGISPAGGGVIHTLRQQPAAVSSKLRILFRAEKLAPHPIAVHPRVPKAVVDKVYRGLKTMSQDRELAPLLARIPVTRFVDATMAEYTPLRALNLQGIAE